MLIACLPRKAIRVVSYFCARNKAGSWVNNVLSLEVFYHLINPGQSLRGRRHFVICCTGFAGLERTVNNCQSCIPLHYVRSGSSLQCSTTRANLEKLHWSCFNKATLVVMRVIVKLQWIVTTQQLCVFCDKIPRKLEWTVRLECVIVSGTRQRSLDNSTSIILRYVIKQT